MNMVKRSSGSRPVSSAKKGRSLATTADIAIIGLALEASHKGALPLALQTLDAEKLKKDGLGPCPRMASPAYL